MNTAPFADDGGHGTPRRTELAQPGDTMTTQAVRTR
jgi:hypothetical protein